MNTYEINKPLPTPHPLPGADVTFIEFTNEFIDLKAYFDKPTPDEIKDWCKGTLSVSVFEYGKCPFLILKSKVWLFDASINILKIRAETQREDWLNTEGNIINLFLIETHTNILKGIRTISVNFSKELRDILIAQILKFQDAKTVEKRLAEIQHSMSTEEMMNNAKIKQEINE
ncbi:hypothetical protein [Elizabethkingia anophelis]|uniref:hypothetical protein n=1 Tax=Elizabethkingia anophelis TaxID=1117645 RepID=UPI0013714144|nr:hypothetical protein [Elizabethkingia anophelis]MYY43960.1 hypothetical protein [Elizabethkingia anophelis]